MTKFRSLLSQTLQSTIKCFGYFVDVVFVVGAMKYIDDNMASKYPTGRPVPCRFWSACHDVADEILDGCARVAVSACLFIFLPKLGEGTFIDLRINGLYPPWT